MTTDERLKAIMKKGQDVQIEAKGSHREFAMSYEISTNCKVGNYIFTVLAVGDSLEKALDSLEEQVDEYERMLSESGALSQTKNSDEPKDITFKKEVIALDSEDLASILLTLSKASCGYCDVPQDMWHLHCCDYNESVYRIVKQVNLENVDEGEYREFVRTLQEKTKEDFEREEK